MQNYFVKFALRQRPLFWWCRLLDWKLLKPFDDGALALPQLGSCLMPGASCLVVSGCPSRSFQHLSFEFEFIAVDKVYHFARQSGKQFSRVYDNRRRAMATALRMRRVACPQQLTLLAGVRVCVCVRACDCLIAAAMRP